MAMRRSRSPGTSLRQQLSEAVRCSIYKQSGFINVLSTRVMFQLAHIAVNCMYVRPGVQLQAPVRSYACTSSAAAVPRAVNRCQGLQGTSID
jgi:hypothetical protein